MCRGYDICHKRFGAYQFSDSEYHKARILDGEFAMSKKFRRQRRTRKFPWTLVMFGGILLIAALLFWSSRDGGDGNGIPSIAVDQQYTDLGYIKLVEYRSLNIKVTNTGEGLLRFKET